MEEKEEREEAREVGEVPVNAERVDMKVSTVIAGSPIRSNSLSVQNHIAGLDLLLGPSCSFCLLSAVCEPTRLRP